MAIFKKRKTSPIINLAASMDMRSNNEVLNIGDEAQRLIAFNLENADLFHSASLETRNGTEDLSNGMAGYPSCETTFVDLPASYGSGLSFYTTSTQPLIDFPGLMLIASGNNVFKSATLELKSSVDKSTFEANPSFYNSNIAIQATLYKMNYIHVPSSGLGLMSGIGASPFNNVHDISLSGNFNSPQYPQFFQYGNALSDVQWIAKTDNDVSFDYTYDSSLGQYVGSGTYTYKFSGPVPLVSGQGYWIRYDIRNADGTTTPRGISIEYLDNPDTDAYPNIRFGEEFFYIGVPTNSFNSIRKFGLEKSSPVTNMKEYCSPGYLIADYPALAGFYPIPVASGMDLNFNKSVAKISATAPVPYTKPFELDSTWLGQYVSLSFSGTRIIYGGYHYAQLRRDTHQYAFTSAFVYNNAYQETSGTTPKTVIYEAGLFKIDSEVGTLVGQDLNVSTSKIASFSGTINFNDDNKNISDAIINPYSKWANYHGQKIYSIFDNPITIASGNYIYAVKYFDDQGRVYQDFSTRTTPTNSYEYMLDISAGVTLNGSGIVTNWNGDDQTFISPSGSYVLADMSCGLISIAPNSAITLLYDYKVQDLNQKVIIGHRDKLYWTNQITPEKENWTVLHSGAAIGTNYLWSAVSQNDLLFAHQYSQSKGQVWASAYPSGSYEHGKRPVINYASGISASGSTLASGTYNLIITASMESGGFRSSEVSGVNVNAGEWIELNINNLQSQYGFDLNPVGLNIFMTASPSGSIYYTPKLYNAPIPSAIEYLQPVANSVTTFYINTPPTALLNDDIPTALVPSQSQSYITSQITTPQFKKVVSYQNYLLGIGVNPSGSVGDASTLFYSDILSPQIWGQDGFTHGTYQIDDNTNSPLTSIEILAQYAIVFKKSSCYRLEFTDSISTPFAVTNISPNIGCLATFSTVVTEKGIFGLSQFGPFVASHASIEIIGQQILPWYKSLSHEDLTFAYVQHDQINSVITWSIGNDETNLDRNFSLVYNYLLDSWSVRRGQSWNVSAPITDSDGFNQLWIGDAIGDVKRDNVGNTDSDLIFDDGDGVKTLKNIQMQIETPWMSFNGAKGSNSDREKLFRFLNFNVETAINSSLVIDVYFNYSPTKAYSRVLPINQGASDKRINLGGQGKIVKLVIYNIGEPNKIRLNKILVEYQDIGPEQPSS